MVPALIVVVAIGLIPLVSIMFAPRKPKKSHNVRTP